MKNVGPIRKELGIRTLFNFLGPMCNPASVRRQVIGVSDLSKVQLIAEALIRSGSERVITLNSLDGLDEVSCAEPTQINEWSVDGKQNSFTISPSDFAFKRHELSEILGSDANTNAKIVMGILRGEKGTRREAVVMNAAVGFYVAGKSSTIAEGRPLAEESIDSGKALAALKALEKVSNL
jgi:anthranilate phosphoribosyltransferase